MLKLLLTTAALLLCTSAQAASIWSEKITCDKTPCRLIHVDGEIFPYDWRTFREIASQDKKIDTVVVLDSPGGSLESGLTMGIGIHTLKYDTLVPANGECSSVCAAMWLAGKSRLVSESGAVGFHQASVTDNQGHKYISVSGNNVWTKYYNTIGMPEPAIAFFLGATPDKIYWLNAALAEGFHIPIEIVSDPEKKKEAKSQSSPETTTVPTKPLAQAE
jgi:hypothetical protein